MHEADNRQEDYEGQGDRMKGRAWVRRGRNEPLAIKLVVSEAHV